MTEPVRTRSEVEREIAELEGGAWLDGAWNGNGFSPEDVSAALLAMAECERCHGSGCHEAWGTGPGYCGGTGLDQSRLARGLNALEGK